MNYSKELSEKIKKIIGFSNVKLTDVSKTSGVGYKTVLDFINKGSNTTLLNVCKIGKGLGIELNFESIKKSIGNNINRFRSNKGLSISKLAILSDVSHSSISSYEKGKINLSLNVINVIANALGISAFDIYDFTEFDLGYVSNEGLEVSYTKPIFDYKTLGKKFSISNNTYNGATRKVEKVYVIDGDTINVHYNNKSYRIRLLVIDTPESVKSNDLWGKRATEFTKYLIDKADNIYIQLDNKVENMDRWKRLLAWVWLEIDGEMKLLNSMLVESGLATVKYVDNEESIHVPILRIQEQQAKDNKRIIWGYKYLDPYWDYELNKAKEPYYIIEVNKKFIQVTDYEMKEWKLSNIPTKFRYKKDCEYLIRYLDDTYKILEKI